MVIGTSYAAGPSEGDGLIARSLVRDQQTGVLPLRHRVMPLVALPKTSAHGHSYSRYIVEY